MDLVCRGWPLAAASAFLFILMSSCGGGSGDGGQVIPGDQDLGGFWSGSLTIDGQPGTQELVGISTDDGRFRFISVDTEAQFVGTARADGTSVTGSGTAYAPVGFTWRDGSIVTTVTMTATIAERDSFAGSWSSGTGESGTFDFAYDPEYEKDSSLGLLNGVWIVYDDNLNPFATFTIEQDGRFTAQNAAGCTSSGRISIIDSRSNVYDIQSTIVGCDIAGDYTGLGALGDLVSPNDVFLFSVSNPSRALLLGLERQ